MLKKETVLSDCARCESLEKQMQEAARNLEFEKAAVARDQLHVLRKRAFGVEPASD